MAEVGSAYVSILPSAKGFARNLGREIDGPLGDAGRRGGRTLGQGVERGGRSSFAAAGKGLAGAFVGAFAAIGVGQVVSSLTRTVIDFAKESIGAASDLNESINAVNVSYGESADEILKVGEAAARGLGLSRNEFNGIAVQFQSFATTIAGKGGDIVGTLSELTTRGADFASVMNLEVSDALSLFQSGLAGETEPLRRYGIDLSAAAVETFALANGIANSASEMTEADKVQARYGLLMQQTAKTTGDFANTSDSLANRQRILKAEFENTRAEIGTALLPIMNDFVGFALDEGIPMLQDLAAWVRENKDAIRLFAVTTAEMTLGAVEGFLRLTDAGLAWHQATSSFIFGVSRSFLSFVGTMVRGAAEAFGWVPGIGPRLQTAAANFTAFERTATQKMDAAEAGAQRLRAGVQAATSVVAGLRTEISQLKDKDVYVRVHTQTTESGRTSVRSTQYRAHGGPVAAGQPYVVGEYEPELFVPDRPGTILNQSQLRALGVGSSGGELVGDLYLDSGEFLGKVRGVVKSEVASVARGVASRPRP